MFEPAIYFAARIYYKEAFIGCGAKLTAAHLRMGAFDLFGTSAGRFF